MLDGGTILPLIISIAVASHGQGGSFTVLISDAPPIQWLTASGQRGGTPVVEAAATFGNGTDADLHAG